MNAQVVFLGTGAALPARGTTNSAYLLRIGSRTILFDCGPTILQQLAAVDVSPGALTHLFISHRHGDHALGFPMLALWWALSLPPAAPLPTLLAGPTTFQSLDAVLDNSYGDAFIANRARMAPRIVLPDAAPGEALLAAGLTVRTLPMQHSAWAPTLGARFEIRPPAAAEAVTLAFTADTGPTDAVLALARDADLLVHDACYSETLNPERAGGKVHATAAEAARHAERAGARHLALVHVDAAAIEGGQRDIYLSEAAACFKGRVSLPAATHTLEF